MLLVIETMNLHILIPDCHLGIVSVLLQDFNRSLLLADLEFSLLSELHVDFLLNFLSGLFH